METWVVVQGVYFALTGAWPLISIKTFQMVTGPKTDLWLVKTVGVLILLIGVVIFGAGFAGRITTEIFLLAVGSALALAVVDINYALKGTIAKIYLLDAVAELLIIGVWFVWVLR